MNFFPPNYLSHFYTIAILKGNWKKKKVGQNNLKVTLLLSQNCGNIIKIDKNCKMIKKTPFSKLQKLISPLIVNKFLKFLLKNEVERYINTWEHLKLKKKKFSGANMGSQWKTSPKGVNWGGGVTPPLNMGF